jgi:hypothetical protein
MGMGACGGTFHQRTSVLRIPMYFAYYSSIQVPKGVQVYDTKVCTKIVVVDSGSQLLRTEAAQHQLSRCLRLRLLLMPAPLSLPCLLQGTTYFSTRTATECSLSFAPLLPGPYPFLLAVTGCH